MGDRYQIPVARPTSERSHLPFSNSALKSYPKTVTSVSVDKHLTGLALAGFVDKEKNRAIAKTWIKFAMQQAKKANFELAVDPAPANRENQQVRGTRAEQPMPRDQFTGLLKKCVPKSRFPAILQVEMRVGALSWKRSRMETAGQFAGAVYFSVEKGVPQ